MAISCVICGGKTNFLTKTELKDGDVCSSCYKKSLNVPNAKCLTTSEFNERLAYLDENKQLATVFSPTVSVGTVFKMDEKNKLFQVSTTPEFFSFSDLVNFELSEDGETLTKGGLGSAVVGGVLLGGVGAVVGGVTGKKKSKAVITDMSIRLSLNNPWTKTLKISLLTGENKKDGFFYNMAKTSANEIVSSLEVILEQSKQVSANVQAPTQNVADEILKYKNLLDIGAITEDEFKAKKSQLLGL